LNDGIRMSDPKFIDLNIGNSDAQTNAADEDADDADDDHNLEIRVDA
jgi:hypothetical protein